MNKQLKKILQLAWDLSGLVPTMPVNLDITFVQNTIKWNILSGKYHTILNYLLTNKLITMDC